MKRLALTRSTMSIIFMIAILSVSIGLSIYVVLSKTLQPTEGFEKLQPMQGSCCGNASAHEVPLWQSSISNDTRPRSNPVLVKEPDDPIGTGGTTTISKTKPNKYDFLNTEIELDEPNIENKQVDREQSKLLSLRPTDSLRYKLRDPRVKRPKMTKNTQPIIKQLKGNANSVWFGK